MKQASILGTTLTLHLPEVLLPHQSLLDVKAWADTSLPTAIAAHSGLSAEAAAEDPGGSGGDTDMGEPEVTTVGSHAQLTVSQTRMTT